jgi:peptide/nickel transport system substrate-binding protein
MNRNWRAATVARASSVALLLGAATAIVACGGSQGGKSQSLSAGSPAQGRPGGTLVWGAQTEVSVIDPTKAIDAAPGQLLMNVYEGLVGFDDDVKPKPKLAESWKQESPTEYVFNIRRGVKFSNGREMNVNDVVGSLRRLVNPKTAANWAAQVGQVKVVSATGPWQVRVVLKEPNTAFLAALANVSASVIPMKELRSGSFDPKKDLLGTGPYMVASHSQGESWNLVRNPYYWQKGLPKTDKLTIRIMGDDAARIAGLRDGSVDVATFDNPDTVKLLATQADVKTVLAQTTEFYRLDVNGVTSIFKDQRLRQAVSLSIDRKQIGDVALAGTGKPTSAVAPGFGICDPVAVPYGTPDPKRAAQLVGEAGAKGKSLSILAPTSYKTLAPIAQVLQSQLQAAGLKVKVEQPDVGVWGERFVKGDFDLSVSFFGSLADPAMGLTWWGPEQTWHSAWDPPDPKLAALINRSHTDPPGPARSETIKQACTRIAENGVIVPLVTKPVVVAYRSDKVTAEIPKLEPYFNALRNIAEFSVNRG